MQKRLPSYSSGNHEWSGAGSLMQLHSYSGMSRPEHSLFNRGILESKSFIRTWLSVSACFQVFPIVTTRAIDSSPALLFKRPSAADLSPAPATNSSIRDLRQMSTAPNPLPKKSTRGMYPDREALHTDRGNPLPPPNLHYTGKNDILE